MTTKAIVVAIAILALTLPTAASAYQTKPPRVRDLGFDDYPLPAITVPGIDFPTFPARPHLDTSRIEENATCAKDVQSCCERTEETGNMWYNNDPVNCGFSCFIGAELQIDVVSHDDPTFGVVDVWGHATCGGAEAKCSRAPQACAGASLGTATDPDENGECIGETDDWVGSDTTATCLSTVKYVCQISEVADLAQWQQCGWEVSCNGIDLERYVSGGGFQICRVNDELLICFGEACTRVPPPGNTAASVEQALLRANSPVSSFAFVSAGVAGACSLNGCKIGQPVCTPLPDRTRCGLG